MSEPYPKENPQKQEWVKNKWQIQSTCMYTFIFMGRVVQRPISLIQD